MPPGSPIDHSSWHRNRNRTARPPGGRAMTGTVLTDRSPAIRALAERWFPVLAREPEVRAAGGDFVCSPAGLWLTLAVAAAGARAGTAAELNALLGLPGADAGPTATAAAAALAETDGLKV